MQKNNVLIKQYFSRTLKVFDTPFHLSRWENKAGVNIDERSLFKTLGFMMKGSISAQLQKRCFLQT
jgi:hypothetical protein